MHWQAFCTESGAILDGPVPRYRHAGLLCDRECDLIPLLDLARFREGDRIFVFEVSGQLRDGGGMRGLTGGSCPRMHLQASHRFCRASNGSTPSRVYFDLRDMSDLYNEPTAPARQTADEASKRAFKTDASAKILPRNVPRSQPVSLTSIILMQVDPGCREVAVE